jgi:hypothetical protein
MVVNLEAFRFYNNDGKRMLPIIILFIFNVFPVYSQENEFKVTYYTPHIEQIKDLGFLKLAEIKNQNMSLNYYRDFYKISDNSKLCFTSGFEYAWFRVNTIYKDNIGYELFEKYTDNYGLKAGISLKYNLINSQNYSISLVPSYSLLARFPIKSYDALGMILNDSTFYVFGYEVDDTGKSRFNHSIEVSLFYKHKLNKVNSINVGLNYLMYLSTYREIKYYTESTYQPQLVNSVAYFYRQLGFSVGFSF